MTTLKQQIENAKLTYPDPQVGEHLIDAAIAKIEEYRDRRKRAYSAIEQLIREAGVTENNAHEHDLKAICWEQMGCTEYYVDGKLVAVLRRDLSVIAPEESDDERRT